MSLEKQCALCYLYCSEDEHSAARPAKWVAYRGKYWNAVADWKPICATCFRSEWREYKHDYADAWDSWQLCDNVNKQFADGLLVQVSRRNKVDPECLKFYE
jgi:hypothetical protein